MTPAFTIATPTYRFRWAGPPSLLLTVFTGPLHVEDLMLLPNVSDDELVGATVFPDDVWAAARPYLLALWPPLAGLPDITQHRLAP